MAASSNPSDASVVHRIKTIEDIEKKITVAIGSAGMAMQELSKDKPKDATVDKYTSTFLQSLDEIETQLSSQISYLSQATLQRTERRLIDHLLRQVATSQQHEGSCYATRKKAQLLHESIAQITRQVGEMINTCHQES